ncbi:MAG: TlpA family protein disulfide reductase [Deltaproteobacteria bacterium]|nr:TlpA family protein disulfide reductase [Deltaproteobacteria bacterium]
MKNMPTTLTLHPRASASTRHPVIAEPRRCAEAACNDRGVRAKATTNGHLSTGVQRPMRPRRGRCAWITACIAVLIGSGTLDPALSTAKPAPKKGTQLELNVAAPDFRLRALDGAMVKLSDLAYPGRERSYAPKSPVFLDFFRTDCKPCLEAMPELVALNNKYAPRGLKVVLVALLEDQDGRGKLEQYLATQKLPFVVVVDGNQMFAKRYLGEVVTLPASFLIDREGLLKQSKYGAMGTYEEHFGADITATLEAHAAATSGPGSKPEPASTTNTAGTPNKTAKPARLAP